MSAIDETPHRGPALDSTVQILSTSQLSNVRRKKESKPSACDYLSVSDMEARTELVTDVLRTGGLVVVFCTAQQFAVWRRMFVAV